MIQKCEEQIPGYGMCRGTGPYHLAGCPRSAVSEEEVERYAEALWYGREQDRVAVALGDEQPRDWNAYPSGEENYDVSRFEYDRDDHRRIVRRMLQRMKT